MKINRTLAVSSTVQSASHDVRLPSQQSYREFIENKVTLAKDHGVPVDPKNIHPALKPHQRDVVEWALRGGRRAIFAAFGLGKTLIQLEIARQIISASFFQGPLHDKALIVCPLGVRQEFARDAKKIGVDTRFVRTDDDVAQTDYIRENPVFLTNYESVREGKIDVSQFTYSMPGETVLDPFSGIGTVPMCAVELGRKAIGIELCHSYFLDGATYTELAAQKLKTPSLLDLTDAETDSTT
jgi:SNF2 family DNA or RNA helicase